jgi:hypothetical protein
MVVEAAPPDLVFFVLDAIRKLKNGETVPSLAAVSPKVRAQSVDVFNALCDMVTYVRACRGDSHGSDRPRDTSQTAELAKAMADPNPIQTVMAAFEINNRSQVCNYLKSPRFANAYPRAQKGVVLNPETIRLCMHEGARVWRAQKTAKAAKYRASRLKVIS